MIETSEPSDGITFSMASREELPMVRELLSANGLPDEDVGEHIEHFLLARNGHALVGTAGVELLGNDTAKEFFGHRGYSVCLRGSVPTGVQGTAEFRSLCPSTAVCMVRYVDDGALHLSRDLLPLRQLRRQSMRGLRRLPDTNAKGPSSALRRTRQTAPRR